MQRSCYPTQQDDGAVSESTSDQNASKRKITKFLLAHENVTEVTLNLIQPLCPRYK